MKIFFTYTAEKKEGFESRVPGGTKDLEADSVDEIQAENVLEKVDDIIVFIEECYRILRKDSKIIFSSPYYASSNAWTSPKTKRGICENSLVFASKVWREANKFSEADILADFEVTGQFAVEAEVTYRNVDVQAFWTKRYNNVAQAVLFTLTKK